MLKGLFDIDRWEEIWQTITNNKSRSILTAFGVFWGMFMLVAMVGAGQALQTGMNAQFKGFATNSAIISSGSTSIPYKGFKKGRNIVLKNEDVSKVVDQVPEIAHFSPVIFGGYSAGNNVSFNGRSGTYSVLGKYPNYKYIEAVKLSYGRFINSIDIAEKRKVCVIGKSVYQQLFRRGENPMGKNLSVNGIYFRIVGVTEKMSNISLFGNSGELVTLPFTTFQQSFNIGNAIDMIAMTTHPGIPMSEVEEKTTKVLKSLHQIAPEDQTAIRSFNLEEQTKMFLYLIIGISTLIWIVGLGTLIAGGIGVSNIMLVTVRERTKEIGIKRALGATPRTITMQIVTESLVLTLIAGIFGILFGVAVLSIVGIFLQGNEMFVNPQISFTIAISGLGVLAIMGLLAGYLPASKAMIIKPIEAIRNE